MFKQPPMVSKGQKTGGAERLEQIHTLLNPPWRWMSSVVLMTSILLSPYAGLRTPGIGPYEGNVHQKSPQIAPDHSKTTQHNSSKSPRIPLHFLQPLVRLWARSWLPTTKAPPVMSEWPPMYLLAEIITSPGMLEKTVEILLEKKHLGILLGTFWAWKKKPSMWDRLRTWKYYGNIGNCFGVLWRKAVPHKICRCEKCCFLMARQSLAQNLSFLWRLYWLLAKRK